MKQFAHLHVHTEFSMLDSAVRIDKIFGLCEERNMPAIAMTDHGNLYGAIEFLKAAVRHTDKDADFYEFMEQRRAFKVKPIIGCEVDMSGDALNRLVLLAKNSAGYHNLIKIVSAGFTEGVHDKPCVGFDFIEAHSEGLIALSGGLSGVVAQEILNDDLTAADGWIKKFKAVFGEDFYIEIQNHGIAEQKVILPHLLRLAKENGVKVVAANDVHYLTKADAEVKRVLRAIAARSSVDSEAVVNDKECLTDELYLKTYDEMYASLPYEDALAVSLEIANKCDPYIIQKESLAPSFALPEGTPNEYLRKLTFEGLTRRYGAITDAVRERAEYELSVIEKLGCADDFLIVWDIINYAESQGIPVGTGRGNSVGSIVAYALGITKIDPLKYAFIFERFLNPERGNRPDFQIDVGVDRRSELLDYITRKYGADNVSQVSTRGIFAAKSTIKAVGRAYGYPYDETDEIAKLVPFNCKRLAPILGLAEWDNCNISFDIVKLREMYESNKSASKILDMAMKIEGMPWQIGMHAARVIICRDAITNHVPLARFWKGEVVTQYNAAVNEELGFFAIDILSLTALTDIQKATDYIKERHGVNIDFKKLGYGDPKVYETLGSGDIEALFALYSSGMAKFMRELQPSFMKDLIAGYSLYRPGLLDVIPDFIRNKNSHEQIAYLHPLLEPILFDTYGIVIYEEQIMKILHRLGGYSMGDADVFLRNVRKKNFAGIEAEREVFINGSKRRNISGAVKKGVPADVANDIYDMLIKFVSCCFSKAHAAAYAHITYQTAYLKCYYPAEYFAALLDNRKYQRDTCEQYLAYMQEHGIPVLFQT